MIPHIEIGRGDTMEKIKKINKKKQLSKMPKSVTTNLTTATTGKTYAYYLTNGGRGCIETKTIS